MQTWSIPLIIQQISDALCMIEILWMNVRTTHNLLFKTLGLFNKKAAP